MSIALNAGAIKALIATETGNQVQSLTVKDRETLWMPRETGKLGGIPLLAPWANRLDGDAYFANGRRYRLNPDVIEIRRDATGLPIHGLLAFCQGWRVVRKSAYSVTSRLEFWREPRWMAQFPFAHNLELTHRLDPTSLQVEIAVENLASEPMPLCIGFHPYFRLSDSPRDKWTLRIAARERVVLSDKLIPTGATSPATVFHHVVPPAGNCRSSDRKNPFTIRREIGPSFSTRSSSVTGGGPPSGISRCHQGVLSSPAFSPTADGVSPAPASGVVFAAAVA